MPRPTTRSSTARPARPLANYNLNCGQHQRRAASPPRPPATRSGSSTPTRRFTSTTRTASCSARGRPTASPRPRTSPPTAPTSGSSTTARTRCSGTPARPAAIVRQPECRLQLQPQQQQRQRQGHRHRRHSFVGRQRHATHRQGVQVHAVRLAASVRGRSTPDNGSPTGITIDPANVDHIWIVDSADDAVYRYNGAPAARPAARTPAHVFQLAGSNTNPQGIADPPPAGVSGLRNVVTMSSPAPARPVARPTAGSERSRLCRPVAAPSANGPAASASSVRTRSERAVATSSPGPWRASS